MTSWEELLSMDGELTDEEKDQLLAQAKSMISGHPVPAKAHKKKRNAVSRPDCPYCHSAYVVLDGTHRDKQRYWCKACDRTFVSTTNTAMSESHYDIDTWKEVISDTFVGLSIDETADSIGASHSTVFRMRHKILLALQYLEEIEPTELQNIAELDETYVLESQKGKKFTDDASRKPRKRGEKATKRGLSNEQVCICTGVERNKGKSYAVTVNMAKPSNSEIKQAFDTHIEEGTVLFTDGLKGYQVLEESVDCKVNGVTTEEMKKSKTANLNNVNSFHSFIKTRYHGYRGVASKYINRYNALFAAGFRDRKETIDKVCELLLTIRDDDIHMSDDDVKNKGLFKGE